jgi:single-strand DNA-binding protein
MNAVTITGRLTKDPELGHVGERPVCDMRIAVDNGRHPTTYIDVATFDATAYACAEYLAKGRLIGVDGTLVLDEWRDAAKRPHQRYKVIGRVEFLDRPPTVEREEAPIGSPADGPSLEHARQPELGLAA